MNADGTTTLTSDFRKNGLARQVPDAFLADGEWRLPPDPDPESARIALRLFPGLITKEPELLAASRLSAADFTPIDFATAWWQALREEERDEWRVRMARVHAAALRYVDRKGAHIPITPHVWQVHDAAYSTMRLEAGEGAYLGWEMGLGKTLGAALVMDAWDVNYALIACPNNAKLDPWVLDAAQFLPWMEFVVVGNDRKARDRALDEARERMDALQPTAIVCHYAALPIIEKKHGPRTVSGWKPLGRFDLKIGDEAHTLLNRKAQFTASFRRMPAVGTLFLSGSVMSGRPEDLFVPWQIMQPKVYRSQHRDWNRPYMESVEDDYGHEIIVGPKLHRLGKFRELLGRSLIVRLAKDYLDVPEATYRDRLLDMHPEQERVYRELADDLMSELPDGDIAYATDGAPLRSALRQVTAGVPNKPCETCNGQRVYVERGGFGPQTVGMEPQAGRRHVCPSCGGSNDDGMISSKHDALMEDIQNAGDSQVLVFAWHKEAVREVQRRCLDAGIPCGLVNGDVPNAAREREIDLFKRGGYRVLAATIKTLSMAANLQNASVVCMIEESDDPVNNEQAIGRVVRQGQRQHATVLRYRIRHSVDDLSVEANYLSKSELRRLILGAR